MNGNTTQFLISVQFLIRSLEIMVNKFSSSETGRLFEALNCVRRATETGGQMRHDLHVEPQDEVLNFI